MALRVSVIVCAHDEARYLAACLHSLLAQSRISDDILVINNASTDATRAVAEAVPGVRVVDEPRKGLVVARETGRLMASGDLLVYVDADCRAPVSWLERIERRFLADPDLIALSGPYRFYDWDAWGRLDPRLRLHARAGDAVSRQVRPPHGDDLLRRQFRRQAPRPRAHRRVRHHDRLPR
jgi:glycosyltransferase involved in cell wall biosynthesis